MRSINYEASAIITGFVTYSIAIVIVYWYIIYVCVYVDFALINNSYHKSNKLIRWHKRIEKQTNDSKGENTTLTTTDKLREYYGKGFQNFTSNDQTISEDTA